MYICMYVNVYTSQYQSPQWNKLTLDFMERNGKTQNGPASWKKTEQTVSDGTGVGTLQNTKIWIAARRKNRILTGTNAPLEFLTASRQLPGSRPDWKG